MFRGFTTTARTVFRGSSAKFNQKRTMAGHAPPPPTDGLEGAVRKYLPENHHVAMGVIGLYFSLYLVSKIVFGGKKKVTDAVPAHGHAQTHAESGVPSVESGEFGDWFGTGDNAEKFFANLGEAK